MTKAVIVLTNVEKYDPLDRATGLWLSELTHFYDVLVENGVETDFVSPNGGYIPLDPPSLLSMDATDWKYYTDSEFRKNALANTHKPSELNAKDYDFIYYAGGHGTVWDFPKSEEIAELAHQIYDNGGIISAVCHGVAGLLALKDDKGTSFVAGKQLTGFSNAEEEANGTTKEVPFLAEDALKAAGALYQSSTPFSDFVVADGRLITGQNPQSVRSLAQKVLETLD
ncbi:type 1 glutamine amidotransferase domain-containing protein [Streptococcus gallolyticus subsp. gallolyticus]|uniref:DJ-1/PfpI domain-containing protein n=1 Tax=Streptococcus gallolyticus (strain UCN34) TaxID=637909 RepID=A0AA36JXT4_STRG3|nr:type 1 glutamine amidotransferase domain-containing protein [Streptococcus gallolyticus]MCF2565681.1 type 1 glutamine amidotransferase domain-containing protein [Streptococcus pasteurianus]KJF00101.1 peptidase C56 [Streptococcus gallolyticus subsp. gallolyticus]MCY7158770.1 type 1 glutamine amidotransferase domain-containing protein [Streptococcus gallolyticus subsp. gallolyticus]MCY7178444.1 type 1 glutamine amidotransferase domain-containing protein [Streptococcus gallolyticus subsp. gallo